MGEKDFLVDAIAQFLQTNEWQDAITQFFAVHSVKFPLELTDEKQSKGVGYTLEQYDVFTQFRDLMERLLETMMGELGCSGEDLVAILQESVRNGPTGERRFLIKTLLSFDDYADFHARITEYAAQQQQVNTVADEHSAERSEWELQLAVAQSLLDAHSQGLLDEAEQSFLPWAEALVGMGHSNEVPVETQEDVVEAKADDEIGKDREELMEGPSEADERLKELEYALIKERLKVDLLVAQRIAEANAAMKKDMLHLSATEVLQSEEQDAVPSAEHTLESLFAQLETARDRRKFVKEQCFEFKNVSPEALDQIYLFLKEKIHFQQDLVSQEKEISDFIFALLDQRDAPLIPLLLEWLLLESEVLRLQGQIQEELGQGATSEPSAVADGDVFWTPSWDENAQAFFYFNSVTGESVWEPPAVGFYDTNQEYQVPDQVPNGDWDAKEISQDSVDLTSGGSDALSAMLVQAASDLDEKIASSSAQNPTEMLEMERMLEKISREHDEERMRLELIFEVEKARQKEELRRRKEKKRREKHLKKKKKKKDDQERQDDCTDGVDDQESADERKHDQTDEDVQLPIVPNSLILAEAKADAKEAGGPSVHFGIPVPGRGRLELAHLLSETHAKRQLEKNGLSVPLAPAPQALLNPTSLRYLAETLAKKNIGAWADESPKSARRSLPVDIALEEADEK